MYSKNNTAIYLVKIRINKQISLLEKRSLVQFHNFKIFTVKLKVHSQYFLSFTLQVKNNNNKKKP